MLQASGLQLIRGRWVEVDAERLRRLLDRFEAIEQRSSTAGLPFAEAMRLMAGANLEAPTDADEIAWSDIAAGDWLATTLRDLRDPQGLANIDPGAALKASLRPYQRDGVRWLYLLTRLGLGACLADMRWRIVIADEAQAIKNPNSRQTQSLKSLAADARIALTGTPVENRLSDLWSIFDFTHPGLLGSRKTFADFSKRPSQSEHFRPLRNLLKPYLLRRLKPIGA